MRLPRPILAMVLCCAVAMCTMPTTACNTSWLQTFDQYMGQIAPAANAVIAILSLFGKTVPAGLGSKIGADASAVTTLVGDFANASASAQPGVHAQIVAAEAVLNQDLQTLYAVAQVSDPKTQQKVSAMVSLCESLIASAFAALPPGTASAQVMAKASDISKADTVASHFAKNFNAVLVEKTGNASVDAETPRLRLPQHGKFVHVLTLNLVR